MPKKVCKSILMQQVYADARLKTTLKSRIWEYQFLFCHLKCLDGIWDATIDVFSKMLSTTLKLVIEEYATNTFANLHHTIDENSKKRDVLKDALNNQKQQWKLWQQ